MDLRAQLEAPITLAPLGRVLVPTGLFIELPQGYEAQVRPRSGLAIKHGLTVLNSPGTIDADYRGEIKVALVNLSAEPFEIQDGERIASSRDMSRSCGSPSRSSGQPSEAQAASGIRGGGSTPFLI